MEKNTVIIPLEDYLKLTKELEELRNKEKQTGRLFEVLYENGIDVKLIIEEPKYEVEKN